MPVFTLQAISVKGRLMAMGGTVKSVNTGGITFATGENPRFLPQKQNSKNSRPAPLVSSDSPLGHTVSNRWFGNAFGVNACSLGL